MGLREGPLGVSGARRISALQKLKSVVDEQGFFGVVGDVSKAHRRYLHRPEHGGVLACKTRADSPTVSLNPTGTSLSSLC